MHLLITARKHMFFFFFFFYQLDQLNHTPFSARKHMLPISPYKTNMLIRTFSNNNCLNVLNQKELWKTEFAEAYEAQTYLSNCSSKSNPSQYLLDGTVRPFLSLPNVSTYQPPMSCMPQRGSNSQNLLEKILRTLKHINYYYVPFLQEFPQISILINSLVILKERALICSLICPLGTASTLRFSPMKFWTYFSMPQLKKLEYRKWNNIL